MEGHQDDRKKAEAPDKKKAKRMHVPLDDNEEIIHLNIRGRFLDVPHAILVSIPNSLLFQWFRPPFPYAVARFRGDPYLNFDFKMFEQVIEVLTSIYWRRMSNPHLPVPSPEYGMSYEGNEFLRMVDHLRLSETIFPFGIFEINTGPEHSKILKHYTSLERTTFFFSRAYETYRSDKVYGNKNCMIKGFQIVILDDTLKLDIGWIKKSKLHPSTEFVQMEPFDNDAVGCMKHSIGLDVRTKSLSITGQWSDNNWQENLLYLPDFSNIRTIRCASFGRLWYCNDVLIASVAGGKQLSSEDVDDIMCNIPAEKFWYDEAEINPCFSLKGRIKIEKIELAFGDEHTLLY
jgi:hypothetical protein